MTDYKIYVPDFPISGPPPDSLSKDFKRNYPSLSAKDHAAMRDYGNQTKGRYLRYVGWLALCDGLSDEQILKKLEVERGEPVAYDTVQKWIKSGFQSILSGRA